MDGFCQRSCGGRRASRARRQWDVSKETSRLASAAPSSARIKTQGIVEQGERPMRIGVAWTPVIPDESERMKERERLRQKLETNLVNDIWLQFGSNTSILRQELAWPRRVRRQHQHQIFGSIFVPSKQWLNQFRFRPWKGVHVGEGFLDDLQSCTSITEEILGIYREFGIVPVVESATSNEKRMQEARRFISQHPPLPPPAPQQEQQPSPPPSQQQQHQQQTTKT